MIIADTVFESLQSVYSIASEAQIPHIVFPLPVGALPSEVYRAWKTCFVESENNLFKRLVVKIREGQGL
jgi:hypothetical protein